MVPAATNAHLHYVSHETFRSRPHLVQLSGVGDAPARSWKARSEEIRDVAKVLLTAQRTRCATLGSVVLGSTYEVGARIACIVMGNVAGVDSRKVRATQHPKVDGRIT